MTRRQKPLKRKTADRDRRGGERRRLGEALEAQSEAERINLSWLLWHHYETSKEKLGELNRKAVENRCVKAIPRVKINANLLPAKHRLYAFNKELTFGDVKVRDCDEFVIVTYILARRDAGIKDNTILRACPEFCVRGIA